MAVSLYEFKFKLYGSHGGIAVTLRGGGGIS